MNIIKTKQQISNIRESGKYLTELLHKLYHASNAGIALIELEFIAEDYIKKNDLKWAFKNYHWFPANLCLSVNDCVVHGIPDEYILKNWDLLKIDCGITYKWGITDSAISLVIGGELANPLGQDLIVATKKALDGWLQYIAPKQPLINYSRHIHSSIVNSWFSVLEKLTGHWVGNKVHEDPHVYNVPHPSMKHIFLQSGMVIALEPITAISSKDFNPKPWNDWNLYCKNGDLGAQWEYTVLVTDNGYEILSGITEDIWF